MCIREPPQTQASSLFGIILAVWGSIQPPHKKNWEIRSEEPKKSREAGFLVGLLGTGEEHLDFIEKSAFARGVLLLFQLAELLQELFLLFAQVHRRFNDHLNQHIAFSASVDIRSTRSFYP